MTTAVILKFGLKMEGLVNLLCLTPNSFIIFISHYEITDVKIFANSSDRNFVAVKIETDEGHYGLCDATLNGREMAVITYLQEHIKPCLIGKEPHQIEDIWQYLYKGACCRRGPITMTAIAGIDIALWDLKGKVAGLAVYQLLGSKSRSKIKLWRPL